MPCVSGFLSSTPNKFPHRHEIPTVRDKLWVTDIPAVKRAFAFNPAGGDFTKRLTHRGIYSIDGTGRR